MTWSYLWVGIVEVRELIEPTVHPNLSALSGPPHSTLEECCFYRHHCPPWRKEEVAFITYPFSQSLVNVINFAKKLSKVTLYL